MCACHLDIMDLLNINEYRILKIRCVVMDINSFAEKEYGHYLSTREFSPIICLQ